MDRFDLLPESLLGTAGLPVLGAVVALALAAVGLSVRRELVKRAAVRAFALAFDAPDPSPIDAGPTVLAGRLESEEKGTPPIVVRKRQSKRPWARRWDDGEKEVTAQPCTLVLHGAGRRVKVAIDPERVAVHTEERLSPLSRGADERRERTQTLEIADGETVVIEGYLDGPLEPAGDEDYRKAPPTLRAPELPHLLIHGRGEIENGRRCSANGLEAKVLLALPVLLLALGLAFEAGVRALEVSVVGEVTNIRDERAPSKNGSVMVPRFDVTFLAPGAFHSEHLRCDRSAAGRRPRRVRRRRRLPRSPRRRPRRRGRRGDRHRPARRRRARARHPGRGPRRGDRRGRGPARTAPARRQQRRRRRCRACRGDGAEPVAAGDRRQPHRAV